MAPLNLNVGCGHVRIPGHVGVDRYPAPAVDVRADILSLPFPDGSADSVRLDHALEHLPYRKAPTAVVEMARVLKPGGRLRVGVPDMRGVAEAYLAADAAEPAVALAMKTTVLRHCFGSQTAEGQYHLSGWDDQTLSDLLASCGFRSVHVRPDTERQGEMFPSIVAEGVKA